jgi:hypothetical protein
MDKLKAKNVLQLEDLELRIDSLRWGNSIMKSPSKNQ